MVINVIAIKYKKQDGPVLIDNEITNCSYLHIFVNDTGACISEDQKENIFRMFHRLNFDPIIANEGNGIGLHLTRLLMERMAGAYVLKVK